MEKENLDLHRSEGLGENTEFAQEITVRRDWNDTDDETRNDERGLGIASIILSVIAFFIWPYLFAPAGIIVGIIGVQRGSSLGWWAIGIGVLALIIKTVVYPFKILF
jgi:hypothetical protein